MLDTVGSVEGRWVSGTVGGRDRRNFSFGSVMILFVAV